MTRACSGGLPGDEARGEDAGQDLAAGGDADRFCAEAFGGLVGRGGEGIEVVDGEGGAESGGGGESAEVVLVGVREDAEFESLRVDREDFHVRGEHGGLSAGVEEDGTAVEDDLGGEAPVGLEIGAGGGVVVEDQDVGGGGGEGEGEMEEGVHGGRHILALSECLRH